MAPCKTDQDRKLNNEGWFPGAILRSFEEASHPVHCEKMNLHHINRKQCYFFSNKNANMQTIEISAAAVLEHHLATFVNNDLDGLMNDYTDESELWTENGVIKGREGIRSFFSYAFGLFPKGSTQLQLKKQIVEKDKAFLIWQAESPSVSVPIGVDTFLFEDDKIVYQSTGLMIQPK